MAFDYSGLLGTANRLITDFGKSATLIKPGEPTGPDYDPQPGEPVESAITLVEVDWKQMYRSETLVQTGDKFWLVSADSDEPTLEDTIRLSGDAQNAVTDDAGYSVGDTEIVIDADSSASGEIKKGDKVRFGDDENKYVVTAGVADVTEGGTLEIKAPGLREDIPAAQTDVEVVADDYQLVNIEPLKPGPTLMMYTVHARR